MMPTLRSALPYLVLLLAPFAPAQEVVEAARTKPDAAVIATTAGDAWERQDWKQAAAAYTKLVALAPDNGMAWHRLGYSLHAQGRLDEALEAHVQAAKSAQYGGVGAYNAACVHALQGRTDAALDWLAKAKQNGFANRDQLAIDTDLDALRDDPRFKAFVDSLPEQPAGGAVKVFAAATPRASTRLLYWGQATSPGQVAIDHGQPTWKDAYQAAIDGTRHVGKRWRLGCDFWTTLDTNLPLRFGATAIAPGSYYLTLERSADGEFLLTFLDPAVVRGRKVDPYLAHTTTGGIAVPLELTTTTNVAEQLEIRLAADEQESTKCRLSIRFGTHVLAAPFTAELGS